MEKFYSVDEIAAVLNVPKSWIYRHTKETGPGAIPRLRVGKYLRFRPNEVMAWIERQNDYRLEFFQSLGDYQVGDISDQD